MKQYYSGSEFGVNQIVMMAILLIVFFSCIYEVNRGFLILKVTETQIKITWPLKAFFIFWSKSYWVIDLTEISKVEYKYGFRGCDSLGFHDVNGNSKSISIDLLFFYRKKLLAYLKCIEVPVIEKRLF